MTKIHAIEVGAEAPDFELPSSELGPGGHPGKKIRLSSYRGHKNVVLVFFPLAFSPVCSAETACLAKTFAPEAAPDHVQLLGVSVDSDWTLAAFQKAQGLNYPLVADFHPKGEVSRKYGLYLEESGYSARATVIVGKNGRVVYVKIQQLPDPRDSRKILAFLKTLS
jgi:peroxiredoxin